MDAFAGSNNCSQADVFLVDGDDIGGWAILRLQSEGMHKTRFGESNLQPKEPQPKDDSRTTACPFIVARRSNVFKNVIACVVDHANPVVGSESNEGPIRPEGL